jgi:hypothetical protein
MYLVDDQVFYKTQENGVFHLHSMPASQKEGISRDLSKQLSLLLAYQSELHQMV